MYFYRLLIYLRKFNFPCVWMALKWVSSCTSEGGSHLWVAEKKMVRNMTLSIFAATSFSFTCAGWDGEHPMTCGKQAPCGVSKGVNNSEGTWGLCKRCENFLKEREEEMCKEGDEDVSLSLLISLGNPFDLPDKREKFLHHLRFSLVLSILEILSIIGEEKKSTSISDILNSVTYLFWASLIWLSISKLFCAPVPQQLWEGGLSHWSGEISYELPCMQRLLPAMVGRSQAGPRIREASVGSQDERLQHP